MFVQICSGQVPDYKPSLSTVTHTVLLSLMASSLYKYVISYSLDTKIQNLIISRAWNVNNPQCVYASIYLKFCIVLFQVISSKLSKFQGLTTFFWNFGKFFKTEKQNRKIKIRQKSKKNWQTLKLPKFATNHLMKFYTNFETN